MTAPTLMERLWQIVYPAVGIRDDALEDTEDDDG